MSPCETEGLESSIAVACDGGGDEGATRRPYQGGRRDVAGRIADGRCAGGRAHISDLGGSPRPARAGGKKAIGPSLLARSKAGALVQPGLAPRTISLYIVEKSSALVGTILGLLSIGLSRPRSPGAGDPRRRGLRSLDALRAKRRLSADPVGRHVYVWCCVTMECSVCIMSRRLSVASQTH